MNFNIRHALVIGLSLNRKCTAIINEIYKKDEQLYYEAYFNSELKDISIKHIFSMKTEDSINKLAGIMEIVSKNKNYIVIENIINKINPSIVKYAKNSYVIDLDEFNEKYNLMNLTEEEIFSYGVSLLYLASIRKKSYKGNGLLNFLLNKWSYFDSVTKGIDDNLSKNDFVKDIIGEGYKTFELDSKESFNCSLEYFISDNIEKSVLKDLGVTDYKNPQTLKNILLSDYEAVRTKKFNESIYRYIGCFSRYINTLGLDSEDMFIDTNINNDILENIFKDFSYSVKYNNVSEDKFELYAISCLFLYNLVTLYKDCKDDFLNKKAETKYMELKEKESKLLREKEKFDIKVRKNKQTIDENKLELKELKKKLKELEKENNQLRADSLKKTETIKELKQSNRQSNNIISKLQEYIDTLDNMDATNNDLSLNEKVDYINEFNIGIFGGMNNIKYLSDKLENITYYTSKNQDISSIENLDMIFINTDFIAHAFTYKIKSISEKTNIPIRYISGTNADKIINKIYIELKE